MYYTNRYTYRYGNEDDAIDCTFKEHDTLDKAIKYANRYAKGVKFAGVTVEELIDRHMSIVYEILSDFTVCDNRG